MPKQYAKAKQQPSQCKTPWKRSDNVIEQILIYLPGVGLIDVDDVAQSNRWNTGVEQLLLWQIKDEYQQEERDMNISSTYFFTKSLRHTNVCTDLMNKHIFVYLFLFVFDEYLAH